MATKNRVIIDTDPGVDDALALLLALSAAPEELQVELISVTYGNVDVQNCLRNVVSLFHQIDKEMVWRKKNGIPEGFDMLKTKKPLVAVGAEEPLADQIMMADFFHGVDGLGGIHATHPHLTPQDTWKDLFQKTVMSPDPDEAALSREISNSQQRLFTPSTQPAHLEILRVLRENEPDAITLVAIGPLTNLATAAATDPETFLRAKEVVVMGGAIDEAGNISPAAEFNVYADSIAAARVFALTSPNPVSTMPPMPPVRAGKQTTAPPPPRLLDPYPPKLSRRLKLTLFPLDITTSHLLNRTFFTRTITPILHAGSPLAEWTTAFLSSTFRKMESLYSAPEIGLQMHDPLTIWYLLSRDRPGLGLQIGAEEDIRVETAGQWTRGMCVIDGRQRKRDGGAAVEGEWEELPGDHGNWLNRRGGNRVRRAVESPVVESFERELLTRIFGVELSEQ